MTAPVRYYAMTMGKPSGVLAEPPTVAIFLQATTVDPPKIPKGARILGRVQGSYAQAVDEAIAYLQALRQITDLDSITMSARLQNLTSK